MAQARDIIIQVSVSIHGDTGQVGEYREHFTVSAPQHPDHPALLADLVTEIGLFKGNVTHAARVCGLRDALPMTGS